MPIETTITTGSAETTTASCEHYEIKQGEAFDVPVTLTLNNETITSEDLYMLDKIVFMIGHRQHALVMQTRDAADAYDSDAAAFLIPLAQSDTMFLRPGIYDCDIDVQFSGGNVLGIHKPELIHILPGLRKEVLK